MQLSEEIRKKLALYKKGLPYYQKSKTMNTSRATVNFYQLEYMFAHVSSGFRANSRQVTGYPRHPQCRCS